jgi:imidazoleglycerol-phosphate dehydratase
MKVDRRTRETDILVSLELAPGRVTSDTGIRFLDHMVVTLGTFAGWTLDVRGRGDLPHHTIEDVGIAIGTTLRGSLPSARARYGHRVIAMDDALVEATVDVGGRPFYEGPVPSSLYDHFFRSFSDNARLTMHIEVRRGRDRHHVVEAAFKAVGLALRDALVPVEDVVSTKGAVVMTSADGAAE